MKIKKRAFTCQRDGLTIRGFEFRPEGERLVPVIVSHGFMANHRASDGYARKLAEDGYAAYTFDFNGGGPWTKSDGATTEMSVLTEVEDLKAVIAYVSSLRYTDSTKLVLMGMSQGGFVSALTAAQMRERVHKLVLFYPALCIPDDARRGQMMRATFDPENVPETFPCGPMKLGRLYAQDVMHMDPIEEISPYTGPVLIVHGSADKVVAYSYAEKAARAYKHAQLVLIEGAGHGFFGPSNAKAISATTWFLNGYTEVLTVDVTLTGRNIERDGVRTVVELPFEGTAAGKYFTGTILPGAKDTQVFRGVKAVSKCADYVLEGKDRNGQACQVHIVNRDDGNGWKPTIETDSKALAYLNDADCEAMLENRKQGPIVHIYTKRARKQ